MHRLGVEITPHARLLGVDADSAYFQHTLSGEAMVFEETDTVVTALGHRSETVLADGLEGWSGEMHKHTLPGSG